MTEVQLLLLYQLLLLLFLSFLVLNLHHQLEMDTHQKLHSWTQEILQLVFYHSVLMMKSMTQMGLLVRLRHRKKQKY